MTSADPSVPAGSAAPEAELKHGAISFVDALVIGLASTSPAYSLAAIIGPVVALVGVYAPGVLVATGSLGIGLGLAPALGAAVARLVQGQDPGLPSGFSPIAHGMAPRDVEVGPGAGVNIG